MHKNSIKYALGGRGIPITEKGFPSDDFMRMVEIGSKTDPLFSGRKKVFSEIKNIESEKEIPQYFFVGTNDNGPIFLHLPEEPKKILADISGNFNIGDYRIYEEKGSGRKSPYIIGLGEGLTELLVFPKWTVIMKENTKSYSKKTVRFGRDVYGKPISHNKLVDYGVKTIQIQKKPTIVFPRDDFGNEVASISIMTYQNTGLSWDSLPKHVIIAVEPSQRYNIESRLREL